MNFEGRVSNLFIAGAYAWSFLKLGKNIGDILIL